MTLGCRAFFREFLAEFRREGRKTNWEKIYDENRIWTGKLLGTAKSRKEGDFGLIGRIGKKFGYEIEAEWMRLDQVWFYYLPKPKDWKQEPWKTDVVIEHENDIKNLEYTIFKLGEVAVPLKVGIFYPGKEREEECLKKCRDMILKQVTSYPGGVYLIIFGFCDDKKGVYWHGYEIDFKGNVIKLHESS